uniref:Uncharacterized protein n=1 Tax=Fagus sylvatica TaxID=28930 RepID=A0A2N9G1K1_FAGSY
MVAAMEESQTQMESLDLETEFLLSKKQTVWPASSSSTVLDDPLLLLLLRLTLGHFKSTVHKTKPI